MQDVVEQFTEASWQSGQEVDAFVQRAGAQPPGVLRRLLEVFTRQEKDATRQRLRCVAFEKLVRKKPDPSLFVPLLTALKTAEIHVRGVVTAVLPLVDSPAEHKHLCQLLRSQDSQLRQVGARLLGQVGGKVAFEVLQEWVKEPGFPGRREAADALVKFARHRAIAPLRTILRVGTVPEQTLALQHLGDPQCVGKSPGLALAAIAELLDADGPLRLPAIAAFARICSEDDYFVAIAPLLDSKTLDEQKAAVEGLNRFRSPRALAALDRKLRSGPTVLRHAVLHALEQIGSDEVLPVLVRGLTHQQLAIRTQAGEVLRTLSQKGTIDVASAIIWLAHSGDVNARRLAGELARGTRNADLWPRLVSLLRDTDWWVRERVADALVELAGHQLTPHVIELLADPSDVVRRFGVELMARLKDPASLEALAHAASDDGDWWVSERAVEAMSQIGGPGVVERVTPLLSEHRLQVVTLAALEKLGARAAASQIAELLSSEDAEVRLAAARCLASFDDPKLVQALDVSLADEDTRVRVVAGDALKRWTSGATSKAATTEIDAFLETVLQREADDLLVVSGQPPSIKKMGRTSSVRDTPVTAAEIERLLKTVLRAEHWHELARRGDVDLSYTTPEGQRFRVNAYKTEMGLAAVFRVIRGEVRTFEALGLPEVVRNLGDLRNGLVIIGGPTGSGKSSTLAAFLGNIVRTRREHIITLEDPVEFVHTPERCLVNQREIGTHATSYARAIRAALRQDPDVLLVGELRDHETISAAVSAAETGHLVLGSLHTVSADASVERLVNVFPAEQQDQVRVMLSQSLRAVVCQYLLEGADAPGRVLALEVMLNNEAVANLIRKGKTHQLPSIIASSQELGMRSMDSDLMRLLKAGRISADEAYLKARSKTEFEEHLASAQQGKGVSLPSLATVLGARAGLNSTPERISAGPAEAQASPVVEAELEAEPIVEATPAPVAALPVVQRERPQAPRAAPPSLIPIAPSPSRGPLVAGVPVSSPSRPPAASGPPPMLVAASPRAPASPGPAPAPVVVVSSPSRPGPPPGLGGAPAARPATSSPSAASGALPMIVADAAPALDEEPTAVGARPALSPIAQAAVIGSGAEEARRVWNEFLNSDDRTRIAPRAAAEFEVILAADPGCASAAYFCGQVHLFRGDTPQARRWFERTLAIDPSHGPAQQRLSSLEG
ncbi:MAG: PilT/PilU family type 4a pilus ATPase [Myxococcales bacterium]|nr:PilT/PilU family type 4a pilus ATPase [Myxococcales bacterium]